MTQNKIFAFLLMSIALIGGLIFFTRHALSDVDPDEVNNIRFYKYNSGLGADGYDVVAYFEESRAVAGKQVFETTLAVCRGVLLRWKIVRSFWPTRCVICPLWRSLRLRSRTRLSGIR